MPFRLDETRAKVQFTTFARMPYLIWRACVETGIVSNTVYVQRAVCEALARDLNMDLGELLDECPDPRSNSKHLHVPMPINKVNSGGTFRIGPANTHEEVR